MNYPDDETMVLLMAFDQKAEFIVTNGLMLIKTVTAETLFVAEGYQIDELEKRGWIELTAENKVGITDAGVYWLVRWMKRKGRAEVKKITVKQVTEQILQPDFNTEN